MTSPKNKNRFVVRFELGLFGIFSVAAVCFLVFLWMFLLGLWAGQTILQPGSGDRAAEAQAPVAPEEKEEEVVPPAAAVAEKQDEQAAPQPAEAEREVAESFFYVLQVSAYRDPELAGQEVARLRSAGYDAFAAPPDGGEDPFTRVYIGRFESLAEATQMAIRLEEQEQIKVYTSRVPAARIRQP